MLVSSLCPNAQLWHSELINKNVHKNDIEVEPTCNSLSMWSYSFSSSATRSQVSMAADWAKVFLHCSHDASGTDRTATHKVLRQAWENNWRKISSYCILVEMQHIIYWEIIFLLRSDPFLKTILIIKWSKSLFTLWLS